MGDKLADLSCTLSTHNDSNSSQLNLSPLLITYAPSLPALSPVSQTFAATHSGEHTARCPPSHRKVVRAPPSCLSLSPRYYCLGCELHATLATQEVQLLETPLKHVSHSG